jgi:hypothetical protein
LLPFGTIALVSSWTGSMKIRPFYSKIKKNRKSIAGVSFHFAKHLLLTAKSGSGLMQLLAKNFFKERDGQFALFCQCGVVDGFQQTPQAG